MTKCGAKFATGTRSIEYIHELLNDGFSLEFIAQDLGIQYDSVTRRISRHTKITITRTVDNPLGVKQK